MSPRKFLLVILWYEYSLECYGMHLPRLVQEIQPGEQTAL